MTANYSKSYLGYLNKLVNENNNSYHGSIGKKLIETDCSALTKDIVTNLTQDLRTLEPRTLGRSNFLGGTRTLRRPALLG